MIEGKIGDEDELYFEIELLAADGVEIIVDALMDTGFSDWIAMDRQDAESLNWLCIGEEVLRIAKGEAKFDIYAGQVKLDRQRFEVPVHVGEGVPEILLGRQWIKTRRLVVDIPATILTLG